MKKLGRLCPKCKVAGIQNGYGTYCPPCTAAYEKQRRKATVVYPRVCPTCSTAYASRDEYGASYYCKPCMATRERARRAKDPARAKALDLDWKRKNPRKTAAWHKNWRAKNLEYAKQKRRENYAANRKRDLTRQREYKQANAKKMADYQRKRNAENPELNRAHVHKHRAAKLQAIPAWYDDDKVIELMRQTSRFAQETGIPWHLDHVVPLLSDRVCGLHWHGNLSPLPGSLNQSKSNRIWPDMFEPMGAN